MLHFIPGVIVVFGGFAVARDIELGLRIAEDLLTFSSFCFTVL